MMTVSALARLMPRPPALVESRKQNCWAPGAVMENQSRRFTMATASKDTRGKRPYKPEMEQIVD